MAKKSLGFVELEWVCPTCNSRNPGSSRTCQGCGSPQPPDVKFVAPGQANITKDEEVARQATAGPDIHCPYCDARNPAGAKVCKQCGGDLTQAEARPAGELVRNFTTAGPGVVKCTTCGTENPANLRTCKNCGAPLPVVKPAPAPKPQAAGGNSCLLIGIGVVVLLVIGVFLFMMLGGGGERTTTVGTVVDSRWVRTIQIMGLRPREYTGWLDDIPADATLGACTDEVRAVVQEPVANAREVCGTPYAVDQGTGFAEVVQDCVYEVLEQQCRYTVNEWQPVDVVTEEGSGFNPTWPSLTGRQREGERTEQYQCVFTVGDTTYVYETRTFAEYQHCLPGSSWTLETNASGRVLSAAPAE
ncbi:MAG: zinc ribbon domain-containing protein [Caldilineaceae bacterium]|nr:zinc ribbon domain-containing protein [Caldilineaceae bacterium]